MYNKDSFYVIPDQMQPQLQAPPHPTKVPKGSNTELDGCGITV